MFGSSNNTRAEWFGTLLTAVDAADPCIWLDSVGLLVKVVTFLGTLHWLALAGDVGVGGRFLCGA